MRLVPFIFGHGAWIKAWRDRVPAAVVEAHAGGAVAIDVLDDESVGFFRLINAANARAFGDLGMPAWVQLDCATLPTAMVGFAAPRTDVDDALVRDLEERAGVSLDDDDLVPLAEFCALPTPEQGHVVGFSLFSLLPGLGLRAKALGLLVMQAQVQTGITQSDPAKPTQGALKTHCRLGPLVVEKRAVQVHSRPRTTLVYRLQVPPTTTLAQVAAGTLRRVSYDGDVREKPVLDEGDVVVDVKDAGYLVAI